MIEIKEKSSSLIEISGFAGEGKTECLLSEIEKLPDSTLFLTTDDKAVAIFNRICKENTYIFEYRKTLEELIPFINSKRKQISFNIIAIDQLDLLPIGQFKHFDHLNPREKILLLTLKQLSQEFKVFYSKSKYRSSFV